MLTLSSSVQDLSVVPGEATISLDVQTLASALQDLTVSSEVDVVLDTLTLSSALIDLGVTPGAVSTLLDTLTLNSSVQDLSVVLSGAITVPLDVDSDAKNGKV